MNRRKLAVFLGIIILLFVIFPDMVAGGAKLGLTLWFHTVLPALLPFMVLSNFMIKQNVTGAVSRAFKGRMLPCGDRAAFGVSCWCEDDGSALPGKDAVKK